MCNLSFSQLSVRNSAYIFVIDEIVFVKDDINLNEANSKIYLRDEAQIIQGTGTTGNSGVGELSVYQESNVGEHEYNFWCSPIGSKTNNDINNPFGISFLNDATGLITSTPAIFTSTSSYNGTSSPLNNEPYWVWKFIASANYVGWVHVKGSTNVNPGEGFTMKGTIGSGDAQRYDFRGKPNNGAISVSVLNTQFTLTGNPYPSALDAHAYIWDTNNQTTITGTLYYWEQDPSTNSHYLNDYHGGYATYTINAEGTVETFISAVFNTFNADGSINISNIGAGSKTARRYIPIGQGFMVEGIANGVVIAKNAHRFYTKETAADSEFFKSSNKKNKTTETNNGFSVVPEDYKRFRLNVDFNNVYTRQLVETFHPTSLDFDYGLESKISEGNILTSDAYLSNNNNTYLAEALLFDETLKIPLTINLISDMLLKVRIADIQNFNENQPIYIHDLETDIFVNLKNQDFEINLESGLYTDRFEITFNSAVLSNSEETISTLKVLQNNHISQLKILNKNSIEIESFNLYDVSGKLVFSDRISSSKIKYTFSTKSLSAGVYIVIIELLDLPVFSKRIVVNNKN